MSENTLEALKRDYEEKKESLKELIEEKLPLLWQILVEDPQLETIRGCLKELHTERLKRARRLDVCNKEEEVIRNQLNEEKRRLKAVETARNKEREKRLDEVIAKLTQQGKLSKKDANLLILIFGLLESVSSSQDKSLRKKFQTLLDKYETFL